MCPPSAVRLPTDRPCLPPLCAPLGHLGPQELLIRLESEERPAGEQALRPVLPPRAMWLRAALLTAVFLLLLVERLVVQLIWPARQQG